MTQPVWPVQCSVSKPASFSGRNGSPALPKIDSIKSRLLTRLPGAKKRISIDFSSMKAGHGRTNHRPDQERNETFRLRRLAGGKRQPQQLRRRLQGRVEQAGKHWFGHGNLVIGYRQTAFGHMKNALGGAAVSWQDYARCPAADDKTGQCQKRTHRGPAAATTPAPVRGCPK